MTHKKIGSDILKLVFTFPLPFVLIYIIILFIYNILLIKISIMGVICDTSVKLVIF